MFTTIWSIATCMLAGYLIGTLNPAYYIAKLHGFDIRQRGSGNAGASNAVLTMGKSVGALIAVLDIAKAVVAVRLAQRIFPNLNYAGEIAGIFTILGHIFPFNMGFRGGKGLASLGGVVLAFNVKVFCVMLLAEIVLALIVDYIVVVPITASAVFPLVYYWITAQLLGALMYAALFPLFVYKHRDNFRRIRAGIEAHVSYLWRKEEEIERLTHNLEKQ